ncbi:MAG: DUF2927 domain-containing protein [Alphaproteobacteria bacterium]
MTRAAPSPKLVALMGLLLGLLTLTAVVFGAALVFWGLSFSALYGVWIFAILIVPPLLVAQGLGALTILTGKRLPRFGPALQSYVAGQTTPFGAPALATALAGRLLGPPGRILPPWPTTFALYAVTTIALTVVWALVQPGEAARFYFGLDGTVAFPRAPEPAVALAIRLWLLTAAAFFPAFVAALSLTKHLLPSLASGPGRDQILAAVELATGIAVAVVASEALYVAAENWATGREAYELGSVEALAEFWRTGFFLRAYVGYPSSGIFFYAALAVPLWVALIAAASSLLRGLTQRGIAVRGMARFHDRPIEAVAAMAFRLVLLVNIGLVFLRGYGTDLRDPTTYDAAAAGARPSIAALTAQFDRLAFGEDDRAVIDKRTTSVGVSVVGDIPLTPRHSATLDTTLADLTSLTGLTFERTARDGALRIAYMPLQDMNPVHFNFERGLAAGPLLTAVCSASPDGEILLGLENDADLNDNCLPHELMHAIGFPGHACAVRPSALCNRDLIARFSDADRILIQTLYDPRLVNGMTRRQALPLVQEAIQERLSPEPAP